MRFLLHHQNMALCRRYKLWGGWCLLCTAALLDLLLFPQLALADFTSNTGYQPGRGYRLGDSGIRLGGYATIQGQGFGESPWAITLDDLSLFITWDNGSKLRFFSELEARDALSIGEHQGLTNRADFLVERLYLDYLVTDTLTLRFGKMLTPIGQWNVIHANPLVWTSTRPVATENLFSEHVNGLMLHGTIPLNAEDDTSLDYSVFGDYSATLGSNATVAPYFDHALGLHLRYNASDKLQIGFSYAGFALQHQTDTYNQLLGLDIAWTYQRLALTGEIVYRHTEIPPQNAWQGYLQGVASLAGHLYAVGRYEFFDQFNLHLGHVGVLGLAYHPSPPLIWKLEYRLGAHNRDLAPDGLFASFSVLF